MYEGSHLVISGDEARKLGILCYDVHYDDNEKVLVKWRLRGYSFVAPEVWLRVGKKFKKVYTGESVRKSIFMELSTKDIQKFSRIAHQSYIEYLRGFYG